LRETEERWGIKARNEMDQIFVQDLFHIVMQIRAVDTVDVVIQLERMNDVEYCCNILQHLTGIHHEPSVVDLFIHNPVNRRTNTASVQAVVEQFSSDQRAWYKLMLKEDLTRCGYALDSDELLDLPRRMPSAEVVPRSGLPKDFRGYELQMLKCEIGRLRSEVEGLQGIWAAVQNSAGWRLVESVRRLRRRVL